MTPRIILLFCSQLCAVVLMGQDTLRLADAMALALENNYGIQVVKKTQKTTENNNTYGNAGFLPTLNADFSQTYYYNNTQLDYSSGQTADQNAARSNTLNGRVQLSWTFFDGMEMFLKKEKLESLQQLGQAGSRAAISNTLSLVLIHYAAMVQQQKVLGIIREAIRLSEERIRISQAKLSLGGASELSYLQGRVDLNSDSSRLLQQINLLEAMKTDFNIILGRDLLLAYTLETEVAIQDNLMYASLEQKLLQQNPEIQAAYLASEVASIQRKMVTSSYTPEIRFDAGYNFARSENDIGLLSYNRTSGINYGLTATLNLFSGGSRNLARRNAIIHEDISVIEGIETLARIRGALINRFRDYTTALALLSLEKENTEVARRNLFVATENYRNGGISDLDLRATQLKLMEAEGRLANARFMAISAVSTLKHLSGSLY